MNNREHLAHELLDAEARSHDVDTERLWNELEGRLWGQGAGTGAHRHSRLAVAAAAAVTAAVAGTAIWATGHGQGPTPAPASSSSAATATSRSSTPVTTDDRPTATPTPPRATATADQTPVTTVPPAAPALSEGNLMRSTDYRTAGWLVGSIATATGWGQSAISVCQDSLAGPDKDVEAVYTGVGYHDLPGRQLVTNQYVVAFRDGASAERAATGVAGWGARCQQLDRVALRGAIVTATPARQVGLPGGSDGQWYTISVTQSDGTRHAELVSVVRAQDRLSVAVLSESNPAGSVDAVDGVALLTRAAARLG
ncbi:hypothetical protein N865_14810 [Intrasporangium oryzae NRRL B-24470]|uniref:PknH-like extracellular domain-containing protein n=1 Tax=Intrasporangium oryzae NRRL B-24470 TaxID=1386089 RepID=W9G382_9MICO|nr:hypothetical protein [Intrasporangium oryzae]EWT00551.1 hypothetical protein N865_14810 [Intrasporangium oryzae NRRL B-24470]